MWKQKTEKKKWKKNSANTIEESILFNVFFYSYYASYDEIDLVIAYFLNDPTNLVYRAIKTVKAGIFLYDNMAVESYNVKLVNESLHVSTVYDSTVQGNGLYFVIAFLCVLCVCVCFVYAVCYVFLRLNLFFVHKPVFFKTLIKRNKSFATVFFILK